MTGTPLIVMATSNAAPRRTRRLPVAEIACLAPAGIVPVHTTLPLAVSVARTQQGPLAVSSTVKPPPGAV